MRNAGSWAHLQPATPVRNWRAPAVFADGGTKLPLMTVKSVRDAKGSVLQNYQDEMSRSRPACGVMTTMMEAVVNSGTG